MKISILVFLTLLLFTLYIISMPVEAQKNTLTKYCSSDICNTNAVKPVFNNTKGFYGVGNYTGGIHLNHSQLIGIQLSKTCLVMIKNDIPNNCLTYDKLVQFDNTNPVYAGKWVSKPWYHRLAPLVANHFNFNENKYIVMVDPNPEFAERARMIYVQDSDKIMSYDLNQTNYNNIIQYHYGRFVDTCETADVAPNAWLVNDTIHYLESDCTDTKYNDTVSIIRDTPAFEWNNPYSSLKWKWDGWSVNETGGNGLANCIMHKCSFIDPYKNYDSKFGW